MEPLSQGRKVEKYTPFHSSTLGREGLSRCLRRNVEKWQLTHMVQKTLLMHC